MPGYDNNFSSFVRRPPPSVPTTRDAFPDIEGSRDCLDLADLLQRHGSDKATRHSYHIAGAGLLAGKRNAPLRILEIGIGTNDPDAPSTMGAQGRPGASLRAWRDWGPRFEVHCADIDRRILFSEDRIATHWIDQTDTASIRCPRRTSWPGLIRSHHR